MERSAMCQALPPASSKQEEGEQQALHPEGENTRVNSRALKDSPCTSDRPPQLLPTAGTGALPLSHATREHRVPFPRS